MNIPTMKAIVCPEYGSPDVLEMREVAKPQPTENQVLVRLHATVVTAADSMMREGKPWIGRLYLGLRRPNKPILGFEFAGVVEAVGASVRRFRVGDPVFGGTSKLGCYAEYVCLDEDEVLTTLPAGLAMGEAAAVCDGPMTSWNFLKLIGKVRPGQRVLINGASGSLGTAAVQLARHLGAEVTGVCSTANLQMVKDLGAHHVIDYTQTDFAAEGKTYDIIYDTVGKSSFSHCKKALTRQGAYLSPVLAPWTLLRMLWTSLFGRKKIRFAATGMLSAKVRLPMLEELKALMAAGKLRSVVDRRFALAEVAEAHRYVDTGRKRGNVVIEMG